MDSFVFLILLFLVGGILQSLAKKKQLQRRAPRPLPGADDSAAKPKDLLEAIKQAFEQVQPEPGERARIPFRRTDESLEEMVEETASLEIEPDVGTLEDLTPRPERAVVDHDDAAEELLARRVKWSEERAKPISPGDHRAFDQRIRSAEPAPPPPPAARERASDRNAALRRMVIWQEVLGTPKSLRESPRADR